jgi:hypothetical protein
MPARAQLDPAGLLEALRAAAAVIDDHRPALDQLDMGDAWDPEGLGPIDGADADDSWGSSAPTETAAGSDLAATLVAVVAAAEGATTFAHLAEALDRGAVGGAIGPAGADRLDAERFAIGLELAAERLTVADDGRHAGCLPAVLAAAADAALGAVDAGADLAEAIISAAAEGLVELESGPRSNPDLVERGVVDAAAAGFLLVLDVFASIVTGEPLPAAPAEPVPVRRGAHRYVVRCRVEPHEGCGLESANWLESTWYELGDLVEFDRTGAMWRAELHTTMPGAAVEAVFDVGRPRELHLGLVEAEA